MKKLERSLFVITQFVLELPINPIKAGGSKSMCSLGGVPRLPPLEKGLRE